MINAYKNFWISYIDFKGTTSRSDWWWNTLCNLIVPFIFGIIFFFSDDTAWILMTSWSLIIFLPVLSMNIRRLRDAGYRWSFVFINFVPIIGTIILFVLLQMPTKKISSPEE